MDTFRLSLFVDLARSRSFSLTAKKFFRSQPAVSIAVQKLEEELGVSLLERGSGPLRLTPAGETLKKQASEILLKVSDLKFQASVLAKKPAGFVKFAAVHSVGLYELSDPIRHFIRRYKHVQLKLHYDDFSRVYDLVQNQDVDFGVVAYPQATHTLEVIPMKESEMVVIAPVSAAFRKKSVIQLADLQGEKFVTFEQGIPTRQAIDRALNKAGVDMDIQFEDNNIETLKKAVEVGMGVSIVPLKSVERDRAGRFRILHLKDRPLRRPIGIVKLRSRRLSGSSALFVSQLQRFR